MKIGDKVRFLSEVGGGIVTGFPEKGMVTVKDNSGFEIPMLEKECIVIETDNYNIVRQSYSSEKKVDVTPEKEEDPLDRPVTFKPMAQERAGGEELNICMAFVPENPLEFSHTKFEAYLINDSNYCLRFALFSLDEGLYALVSEGIAEPNTKIFIDEISLETLPAWEKLTLQGFAYKEKKAFSPKAAIDVTFKVDGTRFYRRHAFGESGFFDKPSFIVDVIKNDKPVTPVYVSPEVLKDALKKETADSHPRVSPARKTVAKKETPEFDLHASEILETTRGMQNKDILEYQLKVFRDAMNEYRKQKGKKLIFIHGKGNGVLRKAVMDEIKHNYKGCTYQDASFQEYGYGATMVTIG